MLSRTFALIVSASLAALVPARATAADPYPSKPIRIIVPSAPGGTLDITTRLFAQKMGERLGQAVVVDNVPGANTIVGIRQSKNLPADGYTLLAQANSYTLLPLISSNAGYDPLKDFTGIGIMLRAPKLVVVSSGLPVSTIQELVAIAKVKNLTAASAGVGSPSHLAAGTFAIAAGVKLTDIPYKGTGAALPDVAAGRVDVLFDALPSSLPYLQANKLRALAFTSSKRVPALPSLPTVQEQGVDYTNELWLGLVARAGTPKVVIDRLSEALRYANESPDLRERLLREGADPSFVSPEDFNRFIQKDVADSVKLVRDLNLPKE